MLTMSTLMMPAPTIAMGAPQITMGPHKPPETKLLAIHPAAAAAAAAQQQQQQQSVTAAHLQHNGQQQHSQQQQQQQMSQQQQQQQQLVGNNSKPGECKSEFPGVNVLFVPFRFRSWSRFRFRFRFRRNFHRQKVLHKLRNVAATLPLRRVSNAADNELRFVLGVLFASTTGIHFQ
ncbi:GM16371 [Drosophila sechellia]|uniref:GM16371 n=1 Tax=Drosophila sechellia TaxID=7238 RepID=B4IGZ5_DROSE|nr:GM16371 [Drosophila sechellia]